MSLTLTFEPLPGQAPQQGAAVFAEGGTLVVVHPEPVRHVDLEALLVDLRQRQKKTMTIIMMNQPGVETNSGGGLAI